MIKRRQLLFKTLKILFSVLDFITSKLPFNENQKSGLQPDSRFNMGTIGRGFINYAWFPKQRQTVQGFLLFRPFNHPILQSNNPPRMFSDLLLVSYN